MSSFAAVFWNEVRLNVKRVAPYVLMILFSANAILWWGWGPAVQRGWATNSDFYIARNLGGFCAMLGLPIFTAIIMGDPVVRDFRLGVTPLIFSTPVGRGSYLLGKFFGNFFVLVCCQSAFAITFCLLQWVHFSGMVTLPVRILPYFKHFFFIVVISHLFWAAFFFAAGTITRSAKIVYGLAACFYPAYAAASFVLRNLPSKLQILVDPMAFNIHEVTDPWRRSADFLNQHVITYSPYAYANRSWLIMASCLFLFIVYRRFAIESEARTQADHFTLLPLAPDRDTGAYVLASDPAYGLVEPALDVPAPVARVTLPRVTPREGPATTLFKIFAAVETEFRLLRAERSLLILLPLVIVLSLFDLAFFRVVPEISYSVTYASGTAKALLLFIVGLIVFYTGEAMHRDGELKVEPIVWSTPSSNSVFLLSKCFATALLAFSLLAAVGLIAIVVQVFRGHTPVDLSAYLIIDGILVVPSIVFMTSFVVALNALLRNKYLAYVVAVGTAAGLLYLYNTGHNHWLYNPLLYRLWTYPDLTGTTILTYRLYCLGLALVCLLVAHLCFQRKR